MEKEKGGMERKEEKKKGDGRERIFLIFKYLLFGVLREMKKCGTKI